MSHKAFITVVAGLLGHLRSLGTWILEKAKDALAFFGNRLTGNRFNQLARELAYADRRRLEIARAMATDPKLLLLDEPTNHLDAESVGWLEQHLKRFEGTNKLASYLHGTRIDLGLIVSNDGVHYREPVPDFKTIPRGKEGEWDSIALTQGHAFENVGERTYIWYAHWDCEGQFRSQEVGLATLRRDDQRWRLVVCGDGPMAEDLAARVAELGLDGAVEMRGYVPFGPEMLALYRDADLLLHVSWTEGVPQVLFEAFVAVRRAEIERLAGQSDEEVAAATRWIP